MIVEGIITVLGLCLTFLPIILYFKYLLTHVSKKTSFDYHLELVRDKKGKIGVVIAYLERIIFGAVICLLGILMSEFFTNEVIFKCLVISIVCYVMLKYFDEKNEK